MVGGSGRWNRPEVERRCKNRQESSRDKAVKEVSNFNYVKVGIEHEMYVCVVD